MKSTAEPSSFEDAENDKLAWKTAPETNEETPLVSPKGKASNALLDGEDFLVNLEEQFGYQLLVLLFANQHLLKGFVNGLKMQATPYLYRAYHVPAPQAQVYSGIVGLPWAMKPILGLVSDILPIMGYHKAPYMLIVSVFSGMAFFCIGLFPSISITVLVVCLLFTTLQISTCDLLSEARYSVCLRDCPSHGPSLVTFVWVGINIGAFAATMLSGVFLDSIGPRQTFLCAAVPAIAALIPVALGYLEEKKTTPAEIAEIRARYFEQREACALCFLMLVGTLAIMIVGLIQHDSHVNCAVSLIVGVMMLASFSVTLTPTIAKVNAFSILYTALGVSSSGAAFYFYTDTPEQYPEGPHFSSFFYNSILGTAGTVFALVGLAIYNKYLSSASYRTMIVGTSLVMSLFSVLDVMMFARLNRKLGIPDHMLVMGLSVFESMIAQWQWMPQVILMSQLCPKGMEATMFALLAGCHNLGMTISVNTGALLLEVLGCRPQGAVGESSQFEHLWIAAAVGSFLPLVAAVTLQHLLPDCKQTEKIDSVQDPTKGSLFRRWTGRDD
ncbi:unnamed protein product [Polarella glacialis]|uniref:Folate/biopterin transporter n=1 Tax=Polarella glacialis TaxID=89957 RepID=A0A813I6H8_POLGL|nr:unnamed protein product [Polarella glacialis]